MVGSFLTVCIFRVPLGLNFIKPSSRCGKCGFPLQMYDNIPILSYVLLRGRCRRCGISYGARHIAIEFLTGLISVFLYVQWGISFEWFFYFTLASLLIVITFIDIDHQIIPDSMTLLPWALGLVLAGIFELKDVDWFVGFSEAVLSSFVGAFGIWFVAYVYQIFTGIEGLGFGDVKLIGFFGAFFGLKAIGVTIFLGSLTGAVFGLAWILYKGKNKRTPIPFGPFLCLGLASYLLDVHTYLFAIVF
ncbi:MAG: prepilin peptidase [Deltaproteobacteria bacterium]|nr:prepilin peptidase [Deltaproteobacteria bacterium]